MNETEDAIISDLIGKTIISYEQEKNDSLVFKTKDEAYVMHHIQDCCEVVEIDDINGNLDDLLNTPILAAEETSNSRDREGGEIDLEDTWTFYRISTFKGTVVITWRGSSNGYYSERVDFCKLR